MASKKSKQPVRKDRTKKPSVRTKTSGKTKGKPEASKKPKRITGTKTSGAKRTKTSVRPAAAKTKETVKKNLKEPASKAKKNPNPREKAMQRIRQKLLMQRASLLAEAEQALNTLPGQTIFPDLGDQASAEIDRNFMLRLRGREQKLLKKIDSSIEKLDSGIFGICEVCGQEIDLKRLEVRPVTTMCIQCKLEQEEEEKLRGA